ncbi:hypothetical protein ACFC6U_40900 [Kitasatospora purpeofusca]|uniref:hypothetical protein n=1 Tax=Kitasatospora purpeofusca TaxID=67352 RepID=UPI0035D883F9
MHNPGRQYYRPNLTAAEERALLRRNYLVLMTGQATLGLIAEDIGIAVEGRPDIVVLHFAGPRPHPGRQRREVLGHPSVPAVIHVTTGGSVQHPAPVPPSWGQ